MEPILKWAGGKRWQLPVLREIIGQVAGVDRIVEPFAGGAALSFGLERVETHLNDVNPYLINLYRHVAAGGFTIRTGLDRVNYNARRAEFNERREELSGERLAELFYYLIRCGFNGLCRFNKAGGFNVPVGRGAGTIHPHDFDAYAQVMQYWTYSVGDFENVRPRKTTDFIYADPPYDEGFTAYTGETFSWASQQRLARWLALHDGPSVATNLATERVLALYQDYGFQTYLLPAPRRISRDGASRDPVMEMIAVNFPVKFVDSRGIIEASR
jgi:DNA adenine methylase